MTSPERQKGNPAMPNTPEEKYREQFEKEKGKKWMTNPVCHGELGFASWGYQLWLESSLAALKQENGELQDKLVELDGKYSVEMDGMAYTVNSLKSSLSTLEREREEALAVCQMHVLKVICWPRDVNIVGYIRELQLDQRKYVTLAQREGLEWIAKKILASLTGKEE